MDRNMKASAIGQYRATEGGLAGAPATRQIPTLAELGQLADKQRANLWEIASLAERVADRLDGASAAHQQASGDNTKSVPSTGSLSDELHASVAAFDEPAFRIRNSLQRIERRLG